MSTKSIASSPSPVRSSEPCPGCAAPLASDQRYCLECGERRAPISSVLAGGPPTASRTPPGADERATPALSSQAASAGPGSTVTVIAGVGVLLLAMGVGVLIGRSSASRPAAAPTQVITVSSTPGAGGTATAASPSAAFTDDWPSGTSGYTVQLQTLPQAGTPVSAVQLAKSADSAKGAKGVGALKSEDFASLKTGQYVIYAGVYHKKSEAEHALAGLKKHFPSASVISVSSSAQGSGGESSGAGGESGAGASQSHPAPPSVLKKLTKKGGQTYEQESKNLPNVISTG